MDAFTVATEVLGDLQLTRGQLAQLRAINHEYWHAVYTILHPPGDDARWTEPATPASEASLTAQQAAGLRVTLERDVRDLLTQEQRDELDRRRPR